MKTITEILGGAQGLLDISFDLQTCFEEKLNDQQKTFLHILRCIEDHLILPQRLYAGTGRKPYQYLPFLRSQFAKNFFQIISTSKLIERLQADPNLRLLCGFKIVPGKASFSRALNYLSERNIINETLEKLVKETFKNKVVYHVCRDSTAIHARETAEKKKYKTSKILSEKQENPRKIKKRQPTEMEKQVPEHPSVSFRKA